MFLSNFHFYLFIYFLLSCEYHCVKRIELLYMRYINVYYYYYYYKYTWIFENPVCKKIISFYCLAI